MENDKIKDLFSSKLTSFEADVPASVWGGLDLLLSQQPIPTADPTSTSTTSTSASTSSTVTSTIGTSIIKGALIVAGVSVVVTGILLYPDKENAPIADEKIIAVSEQEPVVKIDTVFADTLNSVSIRPYNIIREVEAVAISTEEEPAIVYAIQPPVNEANSTSKEDTIISSSESLPQKTEPVDIKKSEVKGFSINLFGSAGLFSNSKIQNGGDFLFSYDDRGSVFKNALKKENSEYKMRHKQPLSVGLTISKGLSKRLFIETGVIYTYLQSDISSSSIFDISEKQSFHYLGIPVSLNYNFYKLRKVDLYLSLGAMIQKDFSGEYESNMGFSKLGLEDRKLAHQIYYGEPYFIREHIKQSNPQLSTHLKLGIAYPIYKKLYLYGTIGGTYYFDARNKYSTIYSDKKLQMNVDLGVKFGF